MYHKLLQAKATFSEALVPPEFASGAMYGLKSALGRVLQVPITFIDYAVGVRSTWSDYELNQRLYSGENIHRRRRFDWYDRWIIYNYFHGLDDLPDYCYQVEPDKNQRTNWLGKAWELGGEHVVLTCQPHLRRGLISTLVEDYRESETCRL